MRQSTPSGNLAWGYPPDSAAGTADKFVYSYYNTNRPNCKQQAGRGQNGSYLSFDLPNTRQSPAMPTQSPTNAYGISDMLGKIVSFSPSCAQLSRMPNNSNAIPLILSSIGNLLHLIVVKKLRYGSTFDMGRFYVLISKRSFHHFGVDGHNAACLLRRHRIVNS